MTGSPGPPVVWSPRYEVDIGPHVFPTAKYRRVVEQLEAAGILRRDGLAAPMPAPWSALGRVHTESYLRKIRDGTLTLDDEARLELPFSPALRDASILCCGGTIATADLALRHRAAAHVGGGFHHAFPDHGEGFCMLNDVAVAAADLLSRGAAERIAVVDLDVHHGNGTAAIFAGDDRVFTFSMHQEDNYPALKPPSDLDVGLPDKIGDADYLETLRRSLPTVFDGHRPEVVFYLAGADPYVEDQLGGLGLTREGIEARDRTVIEVALEADAAVAIVLAGGYAVKTEDTVAIHAHTVRAVLEHATP